MRTEIMSNAGLSAYAEIALILFAIAFLGILWRVFSPRFRSAYELQSRMPLDDLNPQEPRSRGTES
jgi:cbb3-type cytochrome oxidase subunit 3